MKFNIQRSNVQFFCVQNSDNASYTTLCCCYELNTSAHPSPCCCCNMMTASSAFPSPLTSRNCKSLSTLFEYLETKQILTIPVCTAKIYPVQPTPPNLVTQYTWCWCTKNTLVPICTESPRTKCVQLASTCLPRVHPVLLRPPYSSPEDQRRRWQRNRFCSNPAWRQSSELGYPGKDNHKLIIAKIRFFCWQRAVQRSSKRISLGFFVLRRRQTSGVLAVQGKQNWFLASVADGYTHPTSCCDHALW